MPRLLRHPKRGLAGDHGDHGDTTDLNLALLAHSAACAALLVRPALESGWKLKDCRRGGIRGSRRRGRRHDGWGRAVRRRGGTGGGHVLDTPQNREFPRDGVGQEIGRSWFGRASYDTRSSRPLRQAGSRVRPLASRVVDSPRGHCRMRCGILRAGLWDCRCLVRWYNGQENGELETWARIPYYLF